MSKRGAENELTDRNWDDEEEPEDPGVFKQANTDILKERVIAKGKRRGATTSGESTSAFKSAFATFAGFGGASKTDSAGGTGFNFGMSSSKPFGVVVPNGNGSSANDKPSTTSTGLFKQDVSPKSNGASSKQGSNGTGSRYFAELAELNKSVSKWIKQHVDKDPLCILTPIFKDYEKYLESIRTKYPKESKDAEEVESTEEKKDEKKTEAPSSSGLFKIGGSTGSSLFGNNSTSSAATGFSFQSTTSATSSFSSSSTGGSTAFSSGFSFKPTGGATEAGDNKGFSFAINKPSTSGDVSENASAAVEGDEDYVPPEADVKEVSEEDAFYTKRCKLFYKKEGNWVEKGVGNLHLKKLEDDKTQLLVRADTNLGNILLNIRLSPTMPANQQGKNNVCIFCVPNPPVDTSEDGKKPTSMLIRVKTKDDAEELFQKIEEAKGAQSS